MAAAFDPLDSGWIELTLAAIRNSAHVRLSYVSDYGDDLVELLERVADGEFARLGIDEEGPIVWFHVFPGDDYPFLNPWNPARKDHVRFCVSVTYWCGADFLLDMVLPRRVLVASIYRAWLHCHDEDPQRFHDGWSRFGHLDYDDIPAWPFARSKRLDELLSRLGLRAGLISRSVMGGREVGGYVMEPASVYLAVQSRLCHSLFGRCAMAAAGSHEQGMQ